MPAPRRHNLWPTLGRKLCASVALVAYGAAVLGFPLPGTVEKDRSQPFPCQNQPCGCRHAEDSREHCCCFSREAKEAWARSHQVDPHRVVAASDSEPSPGGSCCAGQKLACHQPADSVGGAADSSGQARTDCQSVLQSCSSDACAASTCSQPAAPPSAEGTACQARNELRWQLGVRALQCRGLTNFWVSMGAVLPTHRPVTWSPCGTLTDWLPLVAVFPITRSLCPPDPPPRLPIA
jgi:hypothetical protein